MIAADATDFQPQLQQLKHDNVFVRAITPTFFLALSALKREHRVNDIDLLLWRSANGVDVATMVNGVPKDWRWIEATSRGIETVLDELGGDGDRVLTIGVSADDMPSYENIDYIEHVDFDRDEMAATEATQVSAGHAVPMVDLRNGPLASESTLQPIKRSLGVFVAALLLMQLAIVAALLIRGSQYQQRTDEFVAKQESVFESVFPDQQIPVGILTRLESEHRRLSGTRGIATDNVPKLKSVLPIGHVLLSTLPDRFTARIQVESIDLTPEHVDIKGLASSYEDLETVSTGFQAGGLEVPPVSSSKTKDGVSLLFEGIKIQQTSLKED